MNKFYPVARALTQQHFIDPAIKEPERLPEDTYRQREKTSYLKPGEVPNLLALCRPADMVFTATTNPIAKDIRITKLIFGMWYEGEWAVLESRKEGNIHFCEVSPGIWEINGHISIVNENVYFLDDRLDFYGEPGVILVPIEARYVEQTRTFTLKTSGGYYAGTPELLGIKIEIPVDGEALQQDDPRLFEIKQ